MFKICYRFDWSNEESLKYKDQVVLQVQSIACGTAHAIFMWWDLNMDTENRVIYEASSYLLYCVCIGGFCVFFFFMYKVIF